jgi:hypothetical protein
LAELTNERKEQRIEDREVLSCINDLVNEEHERLRQLEVNLDQCWDLLRQRRALREARLSIDDMDVVEENEAYSSVVLAVQRELEIPDEKLNTVGVRHDLPHPGTRTVKAFRR